ncbi:MAG: TatD family hydrolase, partial [Bacteroidaceae bacterium]|nr:TatD family hydrolase [Bacteroidaceae bacterium]
VFEAQVALSERFSRPITLHIVRAFDLILGLHKRLRPTQRWTVHGFRGKPQLAQQLLDAGFDLSFGHHRNPDAWAITPPDRRHEETDEWPE